MSVTSMAPSAVSIGAAHSSITPASLASAAVASATASSSPVAPDWLNAGHNAWQMTAGTLVALQSIPGLTVLYAGWIKHKWSINSMFMVFYAFACVLVCWVIWGYQMAFGTQMLPLVGYPAISVDMGFELEDSNLPTAALVQAFPQASMVYFQFVFSAITLILIAGSYLGRMNFYAWMIFVPLWMTFSYTIGAFSIWGGGFLYKYGVIDYSGGYVIHLSSGTAGFVGAWWIGPRLDEDRVNATPSNVTLMLVGAGILWIGWNGFNGGDPYAASPDAGAAVLNTNLCTAFSLLTWMTMDLIFFKKPSIIGAVQGMITGLVAITPAAGVVAGWGAILLGLGSGTVPWVSLNVLGRTEIMRKVDDTLDVFHTHFVGAIVGGVGTGTSISPTSQKHVWDFFSGSIKFTDSLLCRSLGNQERLRCFRHYQSRRCRRGQWPPDRSTDRRCSVHHRLEHRLDFSDHGFHPIRLPCPPAYVRGQAQRR